MLATHVTPFGGSWYPDCPADLGLLLEDLFESSRERTGDNLLPDALGFVVPHAGLAYSGAVAAAAYRHVRALQPDLAVILGFAHRGGPAGVSIPDIAAYATPLGTVPTARDAMARLAARQPFQFVAEDRVCDHSVEIQLPLLQHAAPHARVLPLVVGYLDDARRDAAAQALAELCRPGAVFLASSDLTHYGQAFGYEPFPVDSAISARLAHLDRAAMDAMASLDPRFFLEAVQDTRATVCGRAPIALWLRAASLAAGVEAFQEILDYRTSGDITGDYSHTVGYGALGYFPAESFCVDAEGRQLLLESARETLRLLRTEGRHQPVPPRRLTPSLSRKAGVFVSLHQGPNLLGCVGNRVSSEPLAENVPEMTLRAALDDPRFPTVLGVDGEIEIEISILSPMKPIRDARSFHIGLHGAVLESSGRQALLLPQVARGRDWSASQFLGALSMKAGLGSKGYQNAGARLSVFRAQVLGSEAASAA